MARVVVDIECNRLKEPDKIWLICCKDIDTGEYHVFRNVTQDASELVRFDIFKRTVTLWVGHNLLGYDFPVLRDLVSFDIDAVIDSTVDTLVLSKLVDFSRDGHSIENYGEEFHLPKGDFSDWSRYSSEMEEYCKRDVDICLKIYLKYLKVVTDKKWKKPLDLEQRFQLICNELHTNGFHFNIAKAEQLLSKVEEELRKLDKDIEAAFPARAKLARVIQPRLTKHGTLNRNDFRWVADGDLSRFNGGPFCLIKWEEFNPSSHKQIVDVLSAAGWRPTDRTKTHVDFLRAQRGQAVSDAERQRFDLYGWRVNETNIATLPDRAPKPARTLAKRILYESRRRTLTEWLGLVGDDSRIHGEFQGIGAWTHRMAHQKPNTANIPNEYDDQGRLKLLGGDLRSCWGAPRGRLLVGCDAEGIQLRVFAHYINDVDFTTEVSQGDPHTLNKTVLGDVCKDRQAAKRFIYALLLGAGLAKLASILECEPDEAKRALDRILTRYQGFLYLRENVFPSDVRRGWFRGLDGRKVTIPHVAERPHLVCSGYLQNGEAIIMKRATLLWTSMLKSMGVEFKLVDLVHDEWQTECANDWYIAKLIGETQCEALRKVGEELELNCPLAGSFYNKKKKDYTIATNWRLTH